MGAPSFEEMRAAYLATVLDVDHSRVLSAVKAWNAMSDEEKRRAYRRAAAMPLARTVDA